MSILIRLIQLTVIAWAVLMFGLKFEPHHPDPNMNEYIKSAFYLVLVACLSLLHGWGRESKGLHGAGWAARGFMLLIFSGFAFSVYYVRKEAVPLQNYLLSTAVTLGIVLVLFCVPYFLGRKMWRISAGY